MVETQYADTPHGKIAYQAIGDGPLDVLVHTPLFLPVDMLWEEPTLVRFLDRLSSFCRHIWFDPRGRGASDPGPHAEGRFFENIVEDMVSVLDTLESKPAAVLDLGTSAGLLFAATHPERTTALVVSHPVHFFWPSESYPTETTDDELEQILLRVRRGWGTTRRAQRLAPSAAHDASFVRWLARCERLSCPPEEATWRMRGTYLNDLRFMLPTVSVPTLVVSSGRRERAIAECRYLVDHIEGARLIEIAGDDFIFFADKAAPMLDAVEEFLTGRLRPPDIDRVLATVLFTDVVGSTGQAVRLGDRRWRELLAAHDARVRGELERFRGREVKSMGDGFLAIFDGPGRAIRAAGAIRDSIQGLGIQIRAGLHTGEVELIENDIGGIAVHIGQRVSALASPDEVLVSSTVRDLVAGSGIEFEDRGEYQLKGVPDPWRLFAVSS